jgi:hypothetical protein
VEIIGRSNNIIEKPKSYDSYDLKTICKRCKVNEGGYN